MLLLQCENFCAGYEKKEVLTNISFSISNGDYLCIIGENGTGKTTLVESILGLQRNVSGKLEKNFSNNELGYISQQTNIQKDFPATVSEIVLSGFQGRTKFPFYRKAEKEQALLQMKRFGIESFAKKSFKELSGGQKQRVLLARAMCASKKVLVLDEPVTGLDSKITDELYSYIKQINNDGITIIMITHDFKSILDATHVLVIGNESKNYFFGTQQNFLQSGHGKHLREISNANVSHTKIDSE
ncbi:MAG: metal ABC transporter ATP-binding protein, partial [Treponema sp.]|nr:metal ABC transporter ATP-binding protein [Treponema sp.]